MTNEKARDLLAMIKVKEPGEFIVNSWWGSFVNDYKEALQMAIEALEQQPCENCISRVKAIEEADKLCLETDYDNEKVIEMLNDLPPVTPKEKTGWWIRTTDKSEHLVWECNKCGWQQRFNTNFCPDCGARMEVEE